MSEINTVLQIRGSDLHVKDPDARIQAMILKLKRDEALIFSRRIESSLLKNAYVRLSLHTKQLLLAQMQRVITDGPYYGSTGEGILRTFELMIPEMEFKANLPPAPAPLTGIMGLTLATRRKKAKDPKTPLADLLILLQDGDHLVHDNLLTNKSMPLDNLIQDTKRCIKAVEDDTDSWTADQRLMLLAQNEALPADLLKRIVVQAASGWGGRQAQAHALQNKSFPLDMLAELALHGKELVREAVASCTRTPLAVIEQLMHDKCVAVKTEAKTTYERHKEKEEV